MGKLVKYKPICVDGVPGMVAHSQGLYVKVSDHDQAMKEALRFAQAVLTQPSVDDVKAAQRFIEEHGT